VVFILYGYISSGEFFLEKMQVFPDNRKKKRDKEGRKFLQGPCLVHGYL